MAKEKEYTFKKGFKKRTYSLNREMQEKEKFIFDNLIKKSTLTWIEVYDKALDLLKDDIKNNITDVDYQIRKLENEYESNKQQNLIIEETIEKLRESKLNEAEIIEKEFLKLIEPTIEEYKKKHDGKLDYISFIEDEVVTLKNKYNECKLSKYHGDIIRMNDKKYKQVITSILSRHHIQ